jgi:hypothetical protein
MKSDHAIFAALRMISRNCQDGMLPRWSALIADLLMQKGSKMPKNSIDGCEICGLEKDLDDLTRWETTQMACADCRWAYAEGIKDAIKIIETTAFMWIGDKQQISLDKRDLIQEMKG